MLQIKILPKCLRRILKFGDREQIDALREIEHKIALQEKRTGIKIEGNIKEFAICFEISGTTNINVLASSRSEAGEIADAMTECDIDIVDISDIEIKSIVEK
jgi:hypothetical protein